MTGQAAPPAALKKALRAERAAVRDALAGEQRSRWSAAACERALEWLDGEQVNTLLAYVPFRSELDCRPLIDGAWSRGITVLLPRVIRETGAMSLHRVNHWDELAPGAYGIMEPAAAEPVPMDCTPGAVIVPGLAFDRRGGRLGYGRGYYDRLYADWTSAGRAGARPPLWAGLAYGEQVIPDVPMDNHDAYMDILITEDGLIPCRRER
ncbi:5-formyltetrahydrofolate cyclo-ligase [Paenibacillus tengchongensis]|uniref:5-formyltetrahydrofolate cyclo-ligase n=1 Tax=Paenibacillus tengchongensis TaxID=2608684 RepID=UPI00124E8C1A|nr:5-formyltetrahydrofolate cyclo-ligase [Paenibacillus tengchongensis]